MFGGVKQPALEPTYFPEIPGTVSTFAVRDTVNGVADKVRWRIITHLGEKEIAGALWTQRQIVHDGGTPVVSLSRQVGDVSYNLNISSGQIYRTTLHYPRHGLKWNDRICDQNGEIPNSRISKNEWTLIGDFQVPDTDFVYKNCFRWDWTSWFGDGSSFVILAPGIGSVFTREEIPGENRVREEWLVHHEIKK